MTEARKFRIGFVGVGTDLARDFLAKIFDSGTTKLIAVCDKNSRSLKQVCEKYVINGYKTYEDLMENEEIDFAIITIPKAV